MFNLRTLAVMIWCYLLCLPAFAAQEQEIDQTQAIEKAKAATQGKVLKVAPQKDSYRVKMLKDSGRVISVDVDKKSGQVSESRPPKIDSRQPFDGKHSSRYSSSRFDGDSRSSRSREPSRKQSQSRQKMKEHR